MEQLLRVAEVCERLQLGRTRVYEMIAAGELPSITIGATRRVPASALDEWVRNTLAEQHAVPVA